MLGAFADAEDVVQDVHTGPYKPQSFRRADHRQTFRDSHSGDDRTLHR
jgi:hypothetical protein